MTRAIYAESDRDRRRPGAWQGQPADVVRLDYDKRTRRRIVLTGTGGLAFLLDLAKAPSCARATASGSRMGASLPSRRRRSRCWRSPARDAHAAGARCLAPRQPAPRRRDRRARHPYPRRSRDRRHGAGPGRRGASACSAPSIGGRRLRRRAASARAQPRARTSASSGHDRRPHNS